MYYLLDSSFHQKGLGSSGCQSLPLYVYPLKKKSPLNADVASKKALRGLSEGTHEPKPYFNSNTKGDKIQGFRLQVTRGHYQPFSIIKSDKYKLSDLILFGVNASQCEYLRSLISQGLSCTYVIFESMAINAC